MSKSIWCNQSLKLMLFCSTTAFEGERWGRPLLCLSIPDFRISRPTSEAEGSVGPLHMLLITFSRAPQQRPQGDLVFWPMIVRRMLLSIAPQYVSVKNDCRICKQGRAITVWSNLSKVRMDRNIVGNHCDLFQPKNCWRTC